MEENFIGGLTNDVVGFAQSNPIVTAIGVGVISAGIIGAGVAISGNKTTRRNKRASTKRGRSRDRKYISKQKHERRYKRKTKGKRYKHRKSKKSKSKKGIHYTKKGQPYKILANGRARFIKK